LDLNRAKSILFSLDEVIRNGGMFDLMTFHKQLKTWAETLHWLIDKVESLDTPPASPMTVRAAQQTAAEFKLTMAGSHPSIDNTLKLPVTLLNEVREALATLLYFSDSAFAAEKKGIEASQKLNGALERIQRLEGELKAANARAENRRHEIERKERECSLLRDDSWKQINARQKAEEELAKVREELRAEKDRVVSLKRKLQPYEEAESRIAKAFSERYEQFMFDWNTPIFPAYHTYSSGGTYPQPPSLEEKLKREQAARELAERSLSTSEETIRVLRKLLSEAHDSINKNAAIVNRQAKQIAEKNGTIAEAVAVLNKSATIKKE
jgi:DNA repair exonuclease SbcCD ATPase subunit